MSRLSKGVRRLGKMVRSVRLGPLVTALVKVAEQLLGAGTGAIKKQLVMDVMEVIAKRLTEAGKPVPENAPQIVDELIEQAVDTMNGRGAQLAPGGEAAAAPEETVTETPKRKARAVRSKPVEKKVRKRRRTKAEMEEARRQAGKLSPYIPPKEEIEEEVDDDVIEFDDDLDFDSDE